MKKVDIYETVINQDVRSAAAELEKEIDDNLARLPVPPCVPPELAALMRRSVPMLAYCVLP